MLSMIALARGRGSKRELDIVCPSLTELTLARPLVAANLFSMALPAHVLERLPARLRQNGLLTTGDQLSAARSLRARPEGRPRSEAQPDPWGEMLLSGEWPEGVVSELALGGGWAGGTSLALAACRHVQEAGVLFSPEPSWCAFVDPSRSLYAPGVVRAGVRLSHLLVVRPKIEDLARVTLRLVESRSLPLVVVDLVGTPTSPLDVPLGPWGRVVQRLSRALEGTPSRVLLLTDQGAPRPLPLRVGLRVELARPAPAELAYRVTRAREGLRRSESGSHDAGSEGSALELSGAGYLPAMRVSHVA